MGSVTIGCPLLAVDRKWIGKLVAEIWPFEFFQDVGYISILLDVFYHFVAFFTF